MLLTVSQEYMDALFWEIYCNDQYWQDFIQDDVVRAYYFGFLLQPVCDELTNDGFIVASATEQTLSIKWEVRKYKRQLNFWLNKFLNIKREATASEINSYVLNNMVVEYEEDLLKIATVLGVSTYLRLNPLKDEKTKDIH